MLQSKTCRHWQSDLAVTQYFDMCYTVNQLLNPQIRLCPYVSLEHRGRLDLSEASYPFSYDYRKRWQSFCDPLSQLLPLQSKRPSLTVDEPTAFFSYFLLNKPIQQFVFY